MCFMNDMPGPPLPPILTSVDGGIDIEGYVRAARRERIQAQRKAFREIGQWLRWLFRAAPVASRQERLG